MGIVCVQYAYDLKLLMTSVNTFRGNPSNVLSNRHTIAKSGFNCVFLSN